MKVLQVPQGPQLVLLVGGWLEGLLVGILQGIV